MRKFTLSFFLAVLYATNALASGDVVISRAIPVKTDAEPAVAEHSDKAVLNRAGRRVNVAHTAEEKSVTARGTTRTNTKSAESVARTNANVASRSVNTQKSVSSRPTLEEGVNTVGRNARVNSASINSTAAVRRAGLTLRASTAEVGGRAMIIGTDKQTGSNIKDQVRNVQSRAATGFIFGKNSQPVVVTADSLAKAKDMLEKTADLNNTCQQQYNDCMDQFCMVVDANQKRCSCSANLARYVKAQKAVEDANTELNDVAQRIRYVGLSADEIHAIMSATEAEEAMTRNKDTTENRSLLDKIADMIQDPTSKTAATDTSGILDLDFDFTQESDEIFGLGISLSGSSNDISKKRGTELYREAVKRCKSVINNCKEAGGTESQITGNYDLAIDKDCVAYEQGLDKLNKTLVANVRSANLMLQKARLAVLQNKNQYDARGCVGALETCMKDDMVCGENYFKCIDPTKKYVDENGQVVLGQQLPSVMGPMLNYDNSQIDADFIKTAVSAGTSCDGANGSCVVNYLMTKIGTGATFKNGGLCRAVLDKCQDFTYVTNKTNSVYNPYNDIVVNYIQRAMVNIKAAQSKIIAEYASNCLADMSDCYNQQITQINTLTTSANLENIYKVMTGACYNVALTCGYSVFAYNQDIANDADIAKNDCDSCTTEEQKQHKADNVYITAISDVFYQSLLCPENSTFYLAREDSADLNRTKADHNGDNLSQYKGWVNSKCLCDQGYTVWSGACLVTCNTDEYRNALGMCTKPASGCTLNTTDSYKESDGCIMSGS